MAENLWKQARLLVRIYARLRRFRISHDPIVVLESSALAEVTALLGSSRAPDLEVALASGLLYWCRFLVRDQDDDRQDLAAALRLLGLVYDQRPDRLPDQVRAYIDAVRTLREESEADRGARLLRHALDSKSVSELSEAANQLDHALAAAAANHPDRHTMMTNFGAALHARFTLSGSSADLDQAIDITRQALAVTPKDHPDCALRFASFSAALQARFELSRAVVDLDEAIAADRLAVVAAGYDYLNRARYLNYLSVALQTRFRWFASVADLDEALTTVRQAVAFTSRDDPARAEYLSCLGTALQARFERSGSVADLDEAITVGRESIISASHSNRARYLSNLGGALTARFERSGSAADLDEAITADRQALAATPGDHIGQAGMLSNLGGALRRRFERSGSAADLDEAISANRRAVAAARDGHNARYLSNLSGALKIRFERSGSATDLDESISAMRQAVDATPDGHPDRAAMQSNLGTSLLARFKHSGSAADLDEAITVGRLAVATTPHDHPDCAGRQYNLGVTLQARIKQSLSTADLHEATTILRQAAASGTAPPRLRAQAGRTWGQIAGSAGRWSEAAEAYGTAVSLLGFTAPRSLARGDQEHLLESLEGIASNAAACSILAGRPDRAVELLEQGRAVLLGQALDTRTDLSNLRDLHPGLAYQFASMRDAIDWPTRAAMPKRNNDMAASPTSSPWHYAEQQRTIAEAFDRLLTQIRGQKGFADFLRPMPIHELSAASADGPLVIINVSGYGSHALIMTSGSAVDTITLHEVTPKRVADQATDLLNAFEHRAGKGEPNIWLTGLLSWLWDTITGPVLDHLGFNGPPPRGQRWPRLWWCLPGPLSFLPIHAAGQHGTRATIQPQTVIDRAVSSYTPTIRALIHSRTIQPKSDTPDLPAVIVAMPNTAGAPDLPGALDEAAALRRHLGPGAVALIGSQATCDKVIENLPSARRAHFACHSTADLNSPSASCLHLADHQKLTVTDVARLHLNAELAYLSACSTAQPGTRLTDEAIHLASAFQLAGYRHVIGTLWPVSDRAATRTADRIYSNLLQTRSSPARALHAVTRAHRDLQPDGPATWASHIHIGA